METTMKTIAFTWPKGFKSDALHIGLRQKKLDFGWVVSNVPAAAAGVYTLNQFCAAPTAKTKQLIKKNHQLQALVMNSAIANACTGEQGMQDVQQTQKLAAERLGIDPELVGIASTGLIGAYLPMDKIENGIAQLEQTQNTAITSAILTTDTIEKTICVTSEIDGKTCTFTGFAKGSGMIHPNMATMLGFVMTDCAIAPVALQQILSELTDQTFNQITVDGDISTNDMVICLANGQAQNTLVETTSATYQTVKAIYHHILETLAKAIAKDGEGATKLIEVHVTKAKSVLDAQKAAKAIVGSSLVKSAIFGADPNWGRIISSLGATAITLDPNAVTVAINHHKVVEHSQAIAFDEALISQTLKCEDILIEVSLHVGSSEAKAWGCDLTYEYVRINATYTT